MYQQQATFQPGVTYTAAPYSSVYNVEQPPPPPQVTTQGERFRPANQCRDLPFSILFFLHLAGVVAIIIIGLMTTPSGQGFVPATITDSNKFGIFVGMVASLTGVAILVSTVWLQLMKMFAAPMIYLGIAMSVLSFFATAIWLAVLKIYYGTAIFAISGLLMILYFFLARNRIPFAVEMIKTVVGTIQRYPATQVTALSFLLLQIGWLALWSFAFILSQRFKGALLYVAFVFLLFSFYWTFEVLKNIVHVTVSGVVATAYFMSQNMPENPTLGALKRSLTSSFGSICLGSMIVAIIKTLRALVRMIRNERGGILVYIADCILSCFDHLVRYFNHYAFCQVAIYGKTFCEAASSTWDLIEHAGLEAIANDNLIGGVLNMGILFGALVTGAAGACLGLVFNAFNGNDVYVMFVLGLIIGGLFMTLSLQVVDSGVACTFVCFAEDKEILRVNNPILWQRLMETYSLNW